METQTKLTLSGHFTILAISFFLTATSFLLQGHVGLELSDEGFLWYGAQRTALGEVPIRDFMSYDPGRYYWSAFFMTLFDDLGIVSLRIGIAAFQFLGLTLGLYLINSKQKLGPLNIFYLLLTGLTILLWMNPRHKIFDCSLSIILITTLANIIKNSNSRSYLLGGFILGLVAVFGRNHGVYGLFGWLVIFVLNLLRYQYNWSQLKKFVFSWTIGLSLGYSFIILLMIMRPGFFTSFINSIILIFEFGGTNLPLPVPWPWAIDIKYLPLHVGTSQLIVGCIFIVLLFFSLTSLLLLFIRNNKTSEVSDPRFIACSALALPYAHYAFSRADFSHLSQGIQPLILATLIFAANFEVTKRFSVTIGILVLSFLAVFPHQPISKCDKSKCSERNIAGDSLLVRRESLKQIDFINKLEERYGSDDSTFLVVPLLPGAYAVLGKQSPIYGSYPSYPRSIQIQEQEILRIKSARLSFIAIQDIKLDGRESLRFKNTHSFLYDYISQNFRKVESPPKLATEIFVPSETNYSN